MGRKSNWTLEQQLLEGRTIDELTGCWLWRLQSDRGYGKITYYYRTIDVHKAAAHVWLGLSLEPNGAGPLVLHKCPNKHCFNPEHLYLGNQSQNIQDSVKAGTHPEARKTHCPQGHEYTEANTYIYGNGWRQCKACKQTDERKQYMREYRRKHPRRKVNDRRT